MAAETDAPPRTSSRRENVFTRKIGPLPMWAWVAIVSAVILGYAYWKNRQSSSSQAQPATTDASQVPQFVNQTYTTVQPPSEPSITPGSTDTDTSGPPGVSRVHRSPQVKHQINKIHKEHSDYEQDRAPDKKAGQPVHRGTPPRRAPRNRA